MDRRTFATAALAGAIAPLAAASAQQPQEPRRRRHGQGMGLGIFLDPRFVDSLLRQVEQDLEIRPPQRPAWTALAEAVQGGARRLARALPAPGEAAPQRLAGLIAAGEAGLAGLRAIERPLATLYGRLDEMQRQRLDDWFLPRQG